MSVAFPFSFLFFGLFIPVILLYLLKQRRRRVMVSTLLFWDKILRDEQTVTSITRLKKLLSLLLQLLFIALLTLALVRPMFSGDMTGARRIVLLIDSSAGMTVMEGNRSRFDLAQEKAKEVVQGMAMDDTLMPVQVSGTADVIQPFTDHKRNLMEAIENLSVTHEETRFEDALRILHRLPPDERQTVVYLISDGAFEPLAFEPPDGMRFAYLPVGEAKENIGISAFQVRPMPSSPRDFQIWIELVNETEADQTVPLELWVNQGLRDAYEVTIPAGQAISRTYNQFSASGGAVEMVVDFEDAFALDNRAYAILPAPDPVEVLLVHDGNLFLENVLATDDGVQVSAVTPDLYDPNETHEVTVFSNWVPAALPNGHCIFIKQVPAELSLQTLGETQTPIITDWKRDHPIHQHISWMNIQIESAVKFQPHDDFQPLVTSFDDPLVLLREAPEGNVMVVAFDTLHSDLPLRIAFPILISNAVRYLAGRELDARWESVPLGSIYRTSELRSFLTSDQIAAGTAALTRIITPDETEIALFGEEQEEPLVPINRAGVYWGEDDAANRFPLLASSVVSRVESKIKPSSELPLQSAQPLPEIKDGFRLGWELWYALAAAALFLSLVEWGLFHRRVIE